MYWICIPFAALLRLFYSMTGSYGVSLILFTLVIKLVLLPFQMKSKKSMVRMNRMNGRMQEIQKKYAGNQAKMGEELQKLYAEEGVNPMSGCIWSFLPMPILIALYYVIREPIVYFMNFGGKASGMQVLESAKSVVTQLGLTWAQTSGGADGPYAQIEIVKHLANNADTAAVQNFFSANPNWINVDYSFLGLDLSSVPTAAFKALGSGLTWAIIGVLLIPVISGALSFLLSKVTMMGQPTAGAAGASSKMMMLMMPLMSVYIGFILPSALGVYWIAQSGFSIIQEYLLGKFYNQKLEEEESVRAEAREADRKRRMEEAKLRQEEQKQAAKLSLKEKQRLAQEAKTKAKKPSTTEAGRMGDRPYARGRSYQEHRYDNDDE